jgi:hypothetical protein
MGPNNPAVLRMIHTLVFLTKQVVIHCSVIKRLDSLESGRMRSSCYVRYKQIKFRGPESSVQPLGISQISRNPSILGCYGVYIGE